jgi:hypothetical protein
VAIPIVPKLFAAASEVSLHPDANALPGIPTAEKLVNGLAAAVILALLAGALFGVAQWGLSSRTNQPGQASSGKRTVGICIGGVFIVGALAAILNFALAAGGTVHK